MFKTISKLTAGLALGALLLTSCAKDTELVDFQTTSTVSNTVADLNLVGTWMEEFNEDAKVTFNPNGTGTATSAVFYSAKLQASSERTFRWSLSTDSGSSARQLTLNYDGEEPTIITVETMHQNAAKFGGDMHKRIALNVQ